MGTKLKHLSAVAAATILDQEIWPFNPCVSLLCVDEFSPEKEVANQGRGETLSTFSVWTFILLFEKDLVYHNQEMNYPAMLSIKNLNSRRCWDLLSLKCRMLSILNMEIWPFYSPGLWEGYLGAPRPMLLCVSLCLSITYRSKTSHFPGKRIMLATHKYSGNE